MARRVYTVTAPDGSILTHTTPDHVDHTVAVIGYMRLRKRLPKINEEDPNEEIQFERFKSWVMIGTSQDQAKAEQLAKVQGYRNVTEEVRYIPVVGVLPEKKTGESAQEDEELEPVGAASATPQVTDLDAI